MAPVDLFSILIQESWTDFITVYVAIAIHKKLKCKRSEYLEILRIWLECDLFKRILSFVGWMDIHSS